MDATVFSAWQNYQRKVVPITADANQVEETRRAFYAGAFGFYNLMMMASAHADEAQCERELELLHRELLTMLSDLALEQLRGVGRGPF